MTELGRTGIVVSRIGVGTVSWGSRSRLAAYGGTRSPRDEAEALQASLDAGVTLFDTAETYGLGRSERRLGELAAGTGALVATKYAPGLLRLPLGRRSAHHLREALAHSLSRLRRTRVDLFQIHYPVPFISIPALMHRLADAVEAGQTRAVGVSNFSEPQLREAHAVLAQRGIPLASIQVRYSLLHRHPERNGVMRACAELGVTVLAYMPLAMGALSGKYHREKVPFDWWRRWHRAFGTAGLTRTLAVTQRLAEIGRRYDRTAAQVALRWVIQQGAVPIPGAKCAAQARENAGALDFALSGDEMEDLAILTADRPGRI